MRDLASGAEIQAMVQARVDADEAVQAASDRKIIIPMPKPTASESATGCNWTIHYLGQFPGCETRIDDIVEIVQNEVNLAPPSLLGVAV
ncbi:hypothetical protein [Sphingomonas crocodyli]|uniref:Uncharacterized protein n=1 Tax=Sphingomonas crocodyli TaxID=1979270 RepID=A0A437M6L3_9SPHN|nr:hypothetical protein [Sphingomonas crocodyli]RVT93360.1 hypothetical protein EOD43_05635 [Sphingomonas crocodyli]